MPPRPRRAQVALLASLAAVVLAACTSLTVGGYRLSGTSWTAVSVGGEPPVAGWEQTITFDAGGVHGSAGCNGFAGQGPVTISNGHLELGDILTTLGACVGDDGEEAPVMAMERTFSFLLGAADHVEIRDSRLVLSSTAGELVFVRH
jgi:heat shock protein HslJ